LEDFMKIKYLFSFLLICLLILLWVAACGPATAQPAAEAPAEQPVVEQPAEAAPEATQAPAEQPVTGSARFAAFANDDFERNALEMAVEDFRAANPGADLQIVFYP
jgi:ABC-type glycerol-3-phosphate transport system substrate-binding protein